MDLVGGTAPPRAPTRAGQAGCDARTAYVIADATQKRCPRPCPGRRTGIEVLCWVAIRGVRPARLATVAWCSRGYRAGASPAPAVIVTVQRGNDTIVDPGRRRATPRSPGRDRLASFAPERVVTDLESALPT